MANGFAQQFREGDRVELRLAGGIWIIALLLLVHPSLLGSVSAAFHDIRLFQIISPHWYC